MDEVCKQLADKANKVQARGYEDGRWKRMARTIEYKGKENVGWGN